MYDIFISHARADTALAEALYDHLQQGAKCFLDTRDLQAGDEWAPVVARAQRESAMTVVIVTASSEDAYYEREEVAAAISYSRAALDNHRIVPLLFHPEGGAPPLLPYGLNVKHAISVAGEHEIPKAAVTILEALTATRKSQLTASAEIAANGGGMTRAKERAVQFAFLAAFDVKNFSRFNADEQVAVYTIIQQAICDALQEVGLTISKDDSGSVFWSQGGDGGILSHVSAQGTTIFRLALLAVSLIRMRVAASEIKFDIVAALDCGLVHIRPDLNGAPNIWGVPPNRVHRALEACEPGELLASAEFIGQLRTHTKEFNDIIGPRRLRATKLETLLEVHRILNDVATLVPHSSEPIDIVDFEAPNRTMLTQYRRLARGAGDARSGVWSLLLARRRRDLRDISDAEYRRIITSVSRDRQSLKKPHHELFSLFSAQSLVDIIEAGRFRVLDAGVTLCRDGQDAHEMYIVAEGRIEVVEDDVTIVARGPGELVGEMALVDPFTRQIQRTGMLRNASLVAAGTTTVFAIPYTALFEGAQDITAALLGYYERRRKESILTADAALKPILKRLSREDCDSLFDSAVLCGSGFTPEPDGRISAPGLAVVGKGLVKLQTEGGVTRTLREDKSKPVRLNIPPQVESVSVVAVSDGDSEFVYLDSETLATLLDMAKDHGALQQLNANIDLWELPS